MNTQLIKPSSSYRVKKSFFFSSKESYLQIVNVADDDNFIHRLSGPCKLAFEALAQGATVQEINLKITKTFPELSNPEETNDFIVSFIKDLNHLGVLED